MQYEELLESVANSYLGEPGDENAQLKLDSVGYILMNAPFQLNNNSSISRTNIIQNKQLFDYHLLRTGLHVQQKEYNEAIELLKKDKNQFDLTDNQKNQIEDLITIISIQKELYDQDLSWDSITDASRNWIENIANLKYEEMATTFAQYVLAKYDNQISKPKLFDSKLEGVNKNKIEGFEIFPNPTTSKLNIPLSTVSFVIYDINGRKMIIEQNNKNSEINVGLLKNGLYIIILTDQNSNHKAIKFSKI